MQCPRCGFDQPESDECISCGIIISKYLSSISAAQAEPLADDALVPLDDLPPGEVETFGEAPISGTEHPLDGPADAARTTAPAGPVPSGLFRKHSRADEPIGVVAAGVRAVAALTCLGIAILMVANGQGLTSLWPYIIMVFYAGAALWGLTTFRGDVSLQGFATEMVVLVIVTLLLRAGAPEMFAVEEEAQATSATIQPRLPNSALGRFTQKSLDFVNAGLDAIEQATPVSEDAWRAISAKIDFDVVRGQYTVMNTDDKARVYDIWKQISESGPVVQETFERYRESRPENKVAFVAPDAERGALKAELTAAKERVMRLRARILVYPTGGLESVKTSL